MITLCPGGNGGCRCDGRFGPVAILLCLGVKLSLLERARGHRAPRQLGLEIVGRLLSLYPKGRGKVKREAALSSGLELL